MSRDGLLRDESRGVALLGVLGAEHADEVLIRLAFLRHVYWPAPSPEVHINTIIDLLEDHELALTDDEAVATLVASGLIQPANGAFRLADPVLPGVSSTIDGASLGRSRISREDLIAAIFEARSPTSLEAGLGPILRSIDRTSRWGIAIAKATPAELDGVPCFWDYDESGYRPFNRDPASVTTSDALRLIVERRRIGADLPTLSEDDRASIRRLWTKLLDLQRSDSPWTDGSFSVAGEDDDFVGAYDPTQPDKGPCPTVDATGGAIVALACVIDSTASTSADRLAARSRQALVRGTRFLLRTQLPGGGWPLFRYENDAFPMVERDVSSWYAIEALATVALDAEPLAEEVLRAVERFVALAERTIERSARAYFWKPDFVTAFSSESGRLQATATVCMSLDAVGDRWPELRQRTNPLIEGAIRYVTETWDPNPDAIATIDFRVPTWDGPATTRFPWEWPLDALVVQMLGRGESIGTTRLRSKWDVRLPARSIPR